MYHWLTIKENIANPFFAKQLTLISDNSVLISKFTYAIEERIHAINFSESDLIKIIRALNVNKAHGHDNISDRMIKFWTNSVTHPPSLRFQKYLAAGTFANQWKRPNIAPVHKNNDNQIIDQYLFCLYVVKFLKKLFSSDLFTFLRTKTCYLSIGQVFIQVIHVFINCLQWLMTSFQVLTATQL